MLTYSKYYHSIFMLPFVITTILSIFSILFTLSITFVPDRAEAGAVKKTKKILKWTGKGAAKLERKMKGKGKFGKVIAKGARGIRKGTAKASKGISKAQKAVRKTAGKVCKRNCRKIVKTGLKVKKTLARLKRNVEKKCRRFGNNSKACRVAREALEFASPL